MRFKGKKTLSTEERKKFQESFDRWLEKFEKELEAEHELQVGKDNKDDQIVGRNEDSG